ncbi:MAG: hypothetical protein GY861_17320 [bacterium]|nr:hypothetical protein [bacterium]
MRQERIIVLEKWRNGFNAETYRYHMRLGFPDGSTKAIEIDKAQFERTKSDNELKDNTEETPVDVKHTELSKKDKITLRRALDCLVNAEDDTIDHTELYTKLGLTEEKPKDVNGELCNQCKEKVVYDNQCRNCGMVKEA